MTKRGQVSLFIILGIIVLCILGVAVYFVYESNSLASLKEKYETQGLSGQSKAIFDSYKSCFKRIGEEGILHVAARGGYYDRPAKYVEYGNLFIPLYSDTNLPKLKDIEESIAKYIENNMDKCIVLPGVTKAKIKQGSKAKANVDISSDDVEFVLSLPTTIVLGKMENRVSIFRTKTKSSIKKAYLEAVEISKNRKKDSISFDQMNMMAFNKNYVLSPITVNDTLVYFLKFNQTLIHGSELSFNFGLGIKPKVKVQDSTSVLDELFEEKTEELVNFSEDDILRLENETNNILKSIMEEGEPFTDEDEA